MRVRAEQGGNTAVQIKAERPFFRGGLRVKIHNFNPAVLNILLPEQAVCTVKRIFQRIEENNAEQIDHSDLDAPLIDDLIPAPRAARAVVGGADEIFRFIEVGIDLTAAINVVACGD